MLQMIMMNLIFYITIMEMELLKHVTNEKLKHISRFSMGTDTGDINNDGFMDVFTLDMASEDHYQIKNEYEIYECKRV